MLKLYEETNIQDIANAIREKTGKEDKLKVSEMASEIEAIESGGALDETLLWENPNTTVSFVSKNITTEIYDKLKQYQFIKVIALNSRDDNTQTIPIYVETTKLLSGTNMRYFCIGFAYFGNTTNYRYMAVREDTPYVSIGSGYKTSNGSTTKNEVIIPYQIYGVGRKE